MNPTTQDAIAIRTLQRQVADLQGERDRLRIALGYAREMFRRLDVLKSPAVRVILKEYAERCRQATPVWKEKLMQTMDDRLRKMLQVTAPYVGDLPDGACFEVNAYGMAFQADTQERVKKIRAVFPGAVWQKNYSEACKWWEYNSTYDGMELHIYACYEAPPRCRAITETYTAVEKVPVAFEDRAVTKERIRWECGPEGDQA